MHFFTENFGYIALMIVSAGMMIWPEIDRMINGGSEIGTYEATLLMNQKRAIVIDVRASDDFKKSHIPGAKHIPASEIKTRVTELNKFKERPVLLVGSRPVAAMRALKAAGFNDIVQLRGGMPAWLEAGLPTEKIAAAQPSPTVQSS
jgi:rhodanese-related sulfurtransferase